MSKPIGHLLLPTLVCGLAGGIVGVLLDLLRMFQPLKAWVAGIYSQKPFYLTDTSEWSRGWDWVLALLLAVAVSYVILDTDSLWKRLLVLGMVLVLLFTFSPLLMLWNIYWLPVVEWVAVLWAGGCALFYSSQHVMPSELARLIQSQKKPSGQRKKRENEKKGSPVED